MLISSYGEPFRNGPSDGVHWSRGAEILILTFSIGTICLELNSKIRNKSILSTKRLRELIFWHLISDHSHHTISYRLTYFSFRHLPILPNNYYWCVPPNIPQYQCPLRMQIKHVKVIPTHSPQVFLPLPWKIASGDTHRATEYKLDSITNDLFLEKPDKLPDPLLLNKQLELNSIPESYNK